MCLIYTGCIGHHGMPWLMLMSLKVMTSWYCHHNMVDVCNQSDYIMKKTPSEMKGMQEKESITDVRGRQKNLSLGITV